MTEPGFESLFDGVSLTGWSAIPRHYGQLYPGGPTVRTKGLRRNNQS